VHQRSGLRSLLFSRSLSGIAHKDERGGHIVAGLEPSESVGVCPVGRTKHGEPTMQKKFGIAVATALLATPFAALAQGIPGGMERGAAEGSVVGGPVGGVVGGVMSGVAGGVRGLLGADELPAFREHVLREGRSSYAYSKPLRPGIVLPPHGIVYYPVPPEYGVSPRYRYTIVNQHAILVDPRTRRVVQVID
jgi:hypothetical protein